MNTKLRPWIAKKVKEYVGEEDKSLIQFVVDCLKQRAPPQTVETNLVEVLDADAERFTMLLWKMVVFETLRSQLPRM